MIIIEGPDGAGKTTLLSRLQEHYDLPVAPKVVGSNTESMIPSLKVWVEDNVSRGFQATFFDRHRLISEPIYGAVIRSKTEQGFDDLNWLYLMNYQFYARCKPLVIYCLPPYEVVKANVEKDQPKRVREAIRKIYALYVAKASADASLNSALFYDYTNDLYFDAIKRGVRMALEKGEAHV